MKCRRFIRQMTISVGRGMTLQGITDTDQIRGWTGLGSLTNFQRPASALNMPADSVWRPAVYPAMKRGAGVPVGAPRKIPQRDRGI